MYKTPFLLFLLSCTQTPKPEEQGHHGEHGHEEQEHGHGHEEQEHGHGHEEQEHGHEEESEAIEISEIQAEAIKLAAVAPQTITPTLKLRGQLSVNRDTSSWLYPRSAGRVREIYKTLGDDVKKGEVLARIENSTSRAIFEVRSGTSGTVVERNIIKGEYVSEKDLAFKVEDLSMLWAEFYAFDTDFSHLKRGLKVRIYDALTNQEANSTIFFIAEEIAEDSQSLEIRALLDNKDRSWRAGSFIEGIVETAGKDVPLAIKLSAITSKDNHPIAFVEREPLHFIPRKLELGIRGEEYAEVLSGLEAEERYAAEGAFFLKSELLKASATHQH